MYIIYRNEQKHRNFSKLIQLQEGVNIVKDSFIIDFDLMSEYILTRVSLLMLYLMS